MIYIILFIDDDEGTKNFVTGELEGEFQIVDIPLFYENNVPIYSNLKGLLEDILDSKLDAIITDYSFADRGPRIDFDGADLAEEIQGMMPGFPIFVLSAKEEAESSVPDVNWVYAKDEYYSASDKLHRRIKYQIENYRKKVSDAEKKLAELLKKQEDKGLTLGEEEELIKLDCFLESTQLSSAKVPSSLKKTSNIKKLNELITDTEKLIRRMEEEGKDA